MQSRVVITCAITGNFTTRDQNPALPITPEEIAESALAAAEEGAAIAHIHVRDPNTGKPSMELEYYRDAVERIRARNKNLILNITTGPGCRFCVSDEDPRVAAPGTTLTLPENRVRQIEVLKPEIATLDLNTMNSGKDIVVNTPKHVTQMARMIRAAGAKPEIELFDSGDVHLARDLIRSGELEGPGMYSLVLGVKYGFDASPETMFFGRSMLPPGAFWTGFGIGRAHFAMAMQSWLLGGHIRVGMEDTVHLKKGELTPSNAAMVSHIRGILKEFGTEPATSNEARALLGLR
ncbi:MAG: 3-keto-5-aminohexanoate cleavage protein [Alphaproteobacteria bacterium]|nr:3-keto-5-aminohexanoate cleavage protein [Alphaproteobacteria bacterium]MDE2011849.1 3-keto-5-aminohexanoate cleavage protein [Alphaproteobacteria bacterium]MDE2075352.1 3-keto-5-aminohexanoate cleavage protein [Alphaproteobacteria bacterium]